MKTKIKKFLLRTIGKMLPASNQPLGRASNRFRVWCAKGIVQELGNGVNIEKGANVQAGVILKDYAAVGINCLVSKETIIHEHVMMGPDCLIYTSNHKFDQESRQFKGFTAVQPVEIHAHAWLGARCIILPGVTIGKGAIVGAGAVVSKDVPDYHVAAGNPARIVKNLLD